MSLLKRVTDGLAARQVAKARAWWRHQLVVLALVVALGLIAVGGIGFVAMAGYLALRELLLPWAAGLIVGGVLCAAASLGLWWLLRRQRHETPEAQVETETPAREAPAARPEDMATHVGESLGASLYQPQIRTTDVMIAALVAGTVMGASPALRERLMQRSPRGTHPRPGRGAPQRNER